MSWIHLVDEIGLLLHAAKTPSVSGPLNLVAPNPVTHLEFTKTLGSVLHRPTLFPAPALALKLLIGKFADALLGSQRIVPRVAQQSGYQFKYPQLLPALKNLLSRE